MAFTCTRPFLLHGITMNARPGSTGLLRVTDTTTSTDLCEHGGVAYGPAVDSWSDLLLAEPVRIEAGKQYTVGCVGSKAGTSKSGSGGSPTVTLEGGAVITLAKGVPRPSDNSTSVSSGKIGHFIYSHEF